MLLFYAQVTPRLPEQQIWKMCHVRFTYFLLSNLNAIKGTLKVRIII